MNSRIKSSLVATLPLFLFAPAALAQSAAAPSSLPTPLPIALVLGFDAIGVGVLSSGWALAISLSAYAACDREARGAAFIPAVMPGSQGLYSFAIAFLMIQGLVGGTDPLRVALAGIVCGLPNLFSAYGQARTAAACIKSINNGQMDQGQALLATGVPELYGLAGLAGGFLTLNM